MDANQAQNIAPNVIFWISVARHLLVIFVGVGKCANVRRKNWKMYPDSGMQKGFRVSSKFIAKLMNDQGPRSHYLTSQASSSNETVS